MTYNVHTLYDRFFLARDGLTTLGFTAVLAGLMGRRWPATRLSTRWARPVAAMAASLASVSFSLYVTHNPVIDVGLRWAAHGGRVVPMTTASWPLLIGLSGACLGTAIVFSQIFERHHRAIARQLGRILRPRRITVDR